MEGKNNSLFFSLHIVSANTYNSGLVLFALCKRFNEEVYKKLKRG